jgi:hypothetical protein
MVTIPLDEYEVELVRFLAKHYLDNSEVVGYVELPRYEELGRDRIMESTERLIRFGLLRGFSSNGIRIMPVVVGLPTTRSW